jgi:hypothetical protein
MAFLIIAYVGGAIACYGGIKSNPVLFCIGALTAALMGGMSILATM